MTWLSVRLLDKSVRSVTSNKVSLNNSLVSCFFLMKHLHLFHFNQLNVIIITGVQQILSLSRCLAM